MSRIGKKPIPIPSGITVSITGNLISAKGPKGERSRMVHPDMEVVMQGDILEVRVKRESKKAAALWGLTRALIANLIEGVARGYQKKLEMEGIGYRVQMEGPNLVFQLGFSHPVRVEAPNGIVFVVEKNVITISGADKETVGNTAARIRALKKPEPYKGKGIRYQGEVIRRKAGKKGVAAGS